LIVRGEGKDEGDEGLRFKRRSKKRGMEEGREGESV
jgi:hypothetical protein